ncbi:MAG: DnaJ domain-containing protein [Flavobacteriales bacterium]|nr:DnaJ domain-containing protein [Flavobacteriales bacterium]
MKFSNTSLYFLCLFLAVIILSFITKYGVDEVVGYDDLLLNQGFHVFLMFFGGGIGYILYSKYQYNKALESWNSGIFNSKQKYSEDALLEAYIRLGGLMLRKDQDDLKNKMGYLHRYFEQHFTESDTDFMRALSGSFQNPVKLGTITPWLKHHLRSVSQRSQLIYFLAGLSAVDGSINPKEKQFLIQLSDLLDISKKDFDSIMAMYSKYEDAYRDQFKRSQPTKSQREYRREKAAKILGVSVNASPDEIKKAYRSLAKVHHPDRFATHSKEQQEIAEERFVQIQKAYELLVS